MKMKLYQFFAQILCVFLIPVVSNSQSALNNLQEGLYSVSIPSKSEVLDFRKNSRKKTLSLKIDGRDYTLILDKSSVKSKNFRILIQDKSDELKEIEAKDFYTYTGYIKGIPEASASVVIYDEEISVNIKTNENAVFEINSRKEMSLSSKTKLVAKKVSLEAKGLFDSCGLKDEKTKLSLKSKNQNALKNNSGETIKQAEIGFDISYSAYKNRYNEDINAVNANIIEFVNQVNNLWIRDALVEHLIGTIVIRTDPSTCPYELAGDTRATIPNLGRVKDIWNSGVHGDTHNLAALQVGGGGGGWAGVGTVSTESKYSVSDGGSASAWKSFAQHEIGHTWGLVHNHGIQEITPNDQQFGIMWPGIHTRATSDEAATMMDIANNASLTDIGSYTAENIAPYGNRDWVDINILEESNIAIDVIANDYDANADNLSLHSFNPISFNSGAITTDPTNPEILIYTPPNEFTGVDRFYYEVSDGNTTNWGVVYVNVTGPVVIDNNALSYKYDFGPKESLTLSGYTIVTPNIGGDVYWSGGTVEAINRELFFSDSQLYEDFVTSSETVVFNHKIRNGNWTVSFEVGDADAQRDMMQVKIEGDIVESNIETDYYEFKTFTHEVVVTDGELNIEFSDNGGMNPNWMINSLELNTTDENTDYIVNTRVRKYNYDFGTKDSRIHRQFTRITPNIAGEIYWDGNISATDRGRAGGINEINQDFIHSNETATLRHKIKNGIWKIVINLGDKDIARDMMDVEIEGVLYANNVNSAAQEFIYVNADRVEVRDGILDIKFSDNGGVDPDWAVTRLSIEYIEALADDDDADGVINTSDNCANTSSTEIVDNNGCPRSLSVETLYKNDIVVYPNPTQGVINVQLNNGVNHSLTNMSLYSIEGKEVLVLNKDSSESNNLLKMDLTKFNKGFYVLKLNFSDGQSLVKKVVYK
ncbi:hypothetical protein A8C32_09545 [Flavivirga aquatica]|uniref:Secretion system C-terminal sorting domain-containing protein n=1 Tax=Flavivirga aquatica TaxID=1849968 RepID=A0A1E5TEG1_9FLAO|nr:T9SS type A sorting domain-containing protein [Flavivirga aquatica]OEK09750.1 hypothetical protein A8C32_09545 [Flavivirga aquatica]